MTKDWQSDHCSPLQVKKIIDLVTKQDGFILSVKVEDMTKGTAHYVINELIAGNVAGLVKAGVLVRKDIPYSEPLEKREAPVIEGKFRYRVTEGGHLWNYTDFRLEAGGRLESYEADGKLILCQIIEVDQEIDSEIIKKYGLKAERLD
jgi:hypothetical protein